MTLRKALCVATVLSLTHADQCERSTGGSCAHVGCYVYRNAVCVGVEVHQQCECSPPRTCNDNGECVPVGGCAKYTGGTCAYFGCGSSRNAQCVGSLGSAFCMCTGQQCVVDGACVDRNLFGNVTALSATSDEVPTQQARAENMFAGLACLSTLSAFAAARLWRRRARPGGEPLLAASSASADAGC